MIKVWLQIKLQIHKHLQITDTLNVVVNSLLLLYNALIKYSTIIIEPPCWSRYYNCSAFQWYVKH